MNSIDRNTKINNNLVLISNLFKKYTAKREDFYSKKDVSQKKQPLSMKSLHFTQIN